MNNLQRNILNDRGYLLVLVLVFGSVMFLMIASFIGFVVTQSRVQEAKLQGEKALDIAEAGLNYYRWYLAHYPDDITDGSTSSPPYVHTYADPEGGDIGEFSLVTSSSTYCGDIYSIDITSTGSTYADPDIERTVYGRYARPTVAEYSYIINSNVWAGDDRTIIGPYHSNGVIRMDGTNNSTVSSGQENWTCDPSELDCDPYSNWSTVPGVFGDGPNNELWEVGVTPINFTGLTVDLSNMQDKAENGGGLHIGPSGKYGYHLEFQSDGTVNVYRVNGTYNYYGYTNEEGWKKERNVIQNTSYVTSYTIPASCPVMFIEDNVWLDGTVKGKISVAAADVDTVGVDPSIVLNGDITYADANSGLLAIAEDNVLIGLRVPSDMEVNGIFIAQNGNFGRNHYCTYDCSWTYGNQGLPSVLDPYVTRNSLTINGTVVSNGRVGTKWTYDNGGTASGFETRYNSYDRNLVDSPPALTPETSDTYSFIEWLEVE